MIDTTVIKHEPTDRMIGIRFGKNKGRWYLRFDCWKWSFRLTKKEQDASQAKSS